MEDTREEVHRVGHRRFVGGSDDFWDSISDLQFNFLLERGLKASDTVVDIGCGSLRGGIKFIRYLDAGHYLGLDKYVELVIYGVGAELGLDAFREKRPHFVVSDRFEFDKFGKRPTFGIAQSLFTHLSAEDISLCLSNLARAAASGCQLFTTFFETDAPAANPAHSHSHGYFAYTRTQMESFGKDAGWSPAYIGAWNHPRQQRMIQFTLS